MPAESNAPSVPSDKDAILSAPGEEGANVLLTANRYDDPERADGSGRVRWNSNLQWSQATYLLLVENHVRDEAFGLAPDGESD
ncbi:hypothetical protein [Halorubrum sp. Boch-26]|uniref:hypothetical protein n=1 Tax=Halorubrum sp. Boch-26 TaxID=2994426 RepID=UPI00246862EB|nr:hypothetical protein [Halorubrum sp. Boch-26]